MDDKDNKGFGYIKKEDLGYMNKDLESLEEGEDIELF
jgi:hypothetical protein